MSLLVNFFRHRDDDLGETLKLSFRLLGDERIELISYFASSLSDSLRKKIKSYSSIDNEKCKSLVRLLQDACNQSGGGLVAELRHLSEGSSVAIHVVGSQNYTTPSKFLLLQLDYSPQLIEIKAGQSFHAPLGSRLLLPVDHEAEQHLIEFVKRLQYLSVDTESTVLDCLARPSLELRMARLERQVGADARSLGKPFSKSIGKLNFQGGKKVLAGILAAILLVAIGWWKFNVGGKPSDPQVVKPPVTDQPPGPVTPSPALKEVKAPELKKALDDFKSSLDAFPPTSNIGKIRHHFVALPVESALKEMSLALGLVKLVALLQGMPISEEDLGKSGLSITKTLLRNFKATDLTAAELNLLGYLTCHVFPENNTSDRAGLGVIPGSTAIPEKIDLPISCKEIKGRADLADAGLRELTEKLKKHPKNQGS